jgi:hypothetical protein
MKVEHGRIFIRHGPAATSSSSLYVDVVLVGVHRMSGGAYAVKFFHSTTKPKMSALSSSGRAGSSKQLAGSLLSSSSCMYVR